MERLEPPAAKPVAWRHRERGYELWNFMANRGPADEEHAADLASDGWEVEPLYAAAPPVEPRAKPRDLQSLCDRLNEMFNLDDTPDELSQEAREAIEELWASRDCWMNWAAHLQLCTDCHLNDNCAEGLRLRAAVSPEAQQGPSQFYHPDAKRLDWFERQHTLHYSLEVTYVVDGYQIDRLRDGDVTGDSWSGETLRDAIDTAMGAAEGEPQEPKQPRETGGGWQPMERAPRDGTLFLALSGPTHTPVVVRWERSDWYTHPGAWRATDPRCWIPVPRASETTDQDGRSSECGNSSSLAGYPHEQQASPSAPAAPPPTTLERQP